MNGPGRLPADARTSDDGFAPTEFVLFAGMILLPTLLLVLLLPTWWERQTLGRVAAQEAARAAVLAQTWEQAVSAGTRTAAQIGANRGVPGADLAVSFSGALERGSAVTATTSVRVPALPVPFLGRAGFTLTTAHTEPVDQYRSIGADG